MSDRFDLLVLGAGPAGFSTVRAYREAGGAGTVALVTDEGTIPYNRPPLTKDLLRGESSEDDLPLVEEAWLHEQRVALISGRAVALDAPARTVTLSGGRELAYSVCTLATGAEPKRLPVPGADDLMVRVLRTISDLRELLRRLDPGDPVVVIGSGFIGCEIAASLRMRGHPVDLISDEPAPNQARLGVEPAQELRRWLEEAGVELLLDTPVERIEHSQSGCEVIAGSARVTGALVVMAAGVAPRSELAAAAGLELAGGAVPVDAAMRAGGDGSLLACGDVARAFNAAAGRPLRVEHWGDALAQGEVAGQTAAGRSASWSDVPGFWSTIGERTLKYAAWGDGFDDLRLERHRDGGFTAWYGREGRLVGVLAHQADEDYERGQERIEAGAAWSS
jgi:3-phenylpropionate/trans-cinnamate dioxygenase ferredoxin reductase subunit